MQSAEKEAQQSQKHDNGGVDVDVQMTNGAGDEQTDGDGNATVEETIKARTGVSDMTDHEAQKDTPDSKVRFAEKKRLNWKGKSCKFRFPPCLHLRIDHRCYFLPKIWHP